MERLRVVIAVLKIQSSRTLLLVGAMLICTCFPGCFHPFEREPPYYPAGCCTPCQPCVPCQPAATTYAPPVRATNAAPCCCQ
jgi:hypothetical protein